jgi:hypothetical protein
MEITKQELLELITQDDHPEMDLDWNALTQLYTHQLASISPKLTQQELAGMVTLGIALYQKAYKEFEAVERAKLK